MSNKQSKVKVGFKYWRRQACEIWTDGWGHSDSCPRLSCLQQRRLLKSCISMGAVYSRHKSLATLSFTPTVVSHSERF